MMASTNVALCDTLQRLWHRFVGDRSGNLALSFAILCIPLIGAVGAGLDYARALNLHREIQGNLAALVAAVKDIGTKDDTLLKQQLANWLAAQTQTAGAYTLDTSSVVIDRSGHTISPRSAAPLTPLFFGSLIATPSLSRFRRALLTAWMLK